MATVAHDEIDGTYSVVYESRTLNHESADPEEEILVFKVNGTNVNMAVFEEMLEEE